MDFYDEFGLSRSASPEEIRQAYRSVTRLLHPDGQPEPRLKAVAECQMKRANEIFALLLDPQRRRTYDMALAWPLGTPRAHPDTKALPGTAWAMLALRNGFWILILATMVASGLWYLYAGGWEEPAAVTRPAQELVSPAEAFPSLAGTWLHFPASGQTDPLLPPDAELHLAESGGAFAGSYQERPGLPGLRSASGVLLHLEGRSLGERSASLVWTSDDGGEGEMDLVMQTPTLVRATWWTTHLGRRSRVTSGAEVLARREDR